jgi:branched-chain amino acid transport system permease protein
VTEVFGVPVAVILGQAMLGLVNGSFYALLSLGLAVIFGLMGVV